MFNWRLPYLAWAMGQTPHLLTVQVLGIIFSLFSIWLWFDLSRDALGFPAAAAGALLLLGAPIYGFSSDVFLAHEFWAGTLIRCPCSLTRRDGDGPPSASGLSA
jgi:hypothetical protein